MDLLHGLLLLLSLGFIQALPSLKQNDRPSSVGLASSASQIIATNLLKSYIDIDGNQAHSPLGISSILAVLAEGSAGETYQEFENVFGFSKERNGLRASFNDILGRYQNRQYGPEPSFQTWLYIYRNFSAKEDFKKILQDNYYVQVKDINRQDFDWSEPDTSVDLSVEAGSNSKDVIGFETLKRINIDNFDEKDSVDTYGEDVIGKESSKFDRVVDDKQYVEKPVILEEIEKNKEQENMGAAETLEKATEKANVNENAEEPPSKGDETKEKAKRQNDLHEEENETVQDIEKYFKNFDHKVEDEKDLLIDISSSNEPQKVSIPLEALKGVAEKTYNVLKSALDTQLSDMSRAYGARSLFNKDDITSGLSANSITGRELDSKTKMLLFNGLYYRGNWLKPFADRKDPDEDFFFITADDATSTPMMSAKGEYHVSNLEHLNAKAICIPYENKQYSMLLIVPNDIDGLHSVIEKLQPTDFKLIKTKGAMKQVTLTLPKFQVEETSRSESMLKGLGLRKIFSRSEADLSLLSDDPDLHVDEIVQFVNVRVDEGAGSPNVLSASTTLARNGNADNEIIEVNRPFLYFVMDCQEEFVIASGKIYAPEFKEDLPVSIDIELEQA